MEKKLLAIIVLGVFASLSIAGCTSSTNSNQAAGNASQAASSAAATTATTTSASASASATPSATPSPSIVPTPTPTPTPTPPIATSIQVWMGYMGEPAFWLTSPTTNPVVRGQPTQVRYWVNASDGTNPCGAANYYIDTQAAGGQWVITTPQPQYWKGCPAGLPGGAGGLYLSGSDTAKLSPGWHTLIIDYLGSGKYAPCEFKAPFWVVNPGPTTSPL